MWLSFDTPEKHVTNIYCNLKFRAQHHDILCALEKTVIVEVSGNILNVIIVFYDVNLTSQSVANIYSRPKLFITVFRSENLGLLTVTRTDNIWESTKQKLRKQDRKWQIENSRLHKAQTGQKTEKSSWYIKNYEGKEKKRCSIEEIYSFLMWTWFNTIPGELVSSESAAAAI